MNRSIQLRLAHSIKYLFEDRPRFVAGLDQIVAG